MVDDALRFCLVGTFYPPYNFGGDGIYAHRLANALAQRGHRVTVIHSPSAYELLAGGPPREGYDDDPRVTVHGLRTPLGILGLLPVHQTGRAALQGAALRRLLDGGSFDVIHYNNVSLLGGVEAFRFGRGLKLCTLSDHWLVCPMHTLWKFDREVCTRPTCYRCTLAGGRPPQLWRDAGVARAAPRWIDAFLGPSLFTIRQHRTRGLEGTFVHLPQFQRALPERGESGIRAGRPYFLYAGRLEKLKGVQTAIPMLRSRPDVDLLIAGSGSMEAELRALAGTAPNVRFLGSLAQSELAPLYRGALATIVPSLCYETFGLVVAESFAAGTPVIVHAQGALDEIVRTHGGGLIYRDAGELGQAVDALASDAPLRERLAGEARAAFEREFSERVHLDRYLALVRELIARKRAGHPLARAHHEELEPRLAGRPVFVEPPARGGARESGPA
ncbi:MAG TPA: glycosyltransferase family 4 protein [Casimicrobiaceae bacterium]|nr:glycosyltransferase family 4 protein [Casimicrobiaceae bacterium]